MNPILWQKVEELFNAVLALPPEKRRAFLDGVCGEEAGLRAEVESLVKEAEGQPDNFLSESAFTLGTRLLCQDASGSLIGCTLGAYTVTQLIGRGGMGEVYLAEDPRLERLVALKLLPEAVDGLGADALRFQQEARAASGVSHPNVAHIYEIGEANGRRYIAMEYVRGENLRTLLGRGPLGVSEAVEIASQVAGALAAAHAAGVVHRDIKPENIVVRPDGYVKVLDFGLAELTRAEGGAAGGHARPGPKPMPGLIMGTVAYMSPEHVSGREVDARADVWSLGVIMYEMLAGCRPFTGEGRGDIGEAILTQDPEPLVADNPLTSGLAVIASKALAKDPDARYQTAAEMARELNLIKQRLQFEEHISGATRAGVGTLDSGFGRAIFSNNSLFPRLRSQEVSPPRRSRASLAAKVALSTLFVLVALYAGKYVRQSGTDHGDLPAEQGAAAASPQRIRSLVILPFVNETGDASFDFVTAGLTEDISRNLSRSRSLLVIDQYSARRAAERPGGLDQLGRLLGAEAALECRISRQGAGLLVRQRLVDLGTGEAVWQDSFTAGQQDILRLRDSLTAMLTTSLQGFLGEDKSVLLDKHPTNDREAYKLYLEGKHLLDKRDVDSLEISVEKFEESIRRDPQFALAHTALANSYNLLGAYLGHRPQVNLPKARRAIMRSLSLDDSQVEAHTSLAKIKMDEERDFIGAEREFQRAIELNPSYALAHHWYGEVYLSAMGRLDESLAELEAARRLNPLSTGIITGIAWSYIGLRRYEEAVRECRRAEGLNPEAWDIYSYRAMALMKLGRFDEAIRDAETAHRQAPTASTHAALGAIYASAGRRPEALGVLHELETSPRWGEPSHYDLAIIYAALGDADAAFALLDKEATAESADLLSIRIDPMLDALRPDARFAALEHKLNLP